MPEVTHKDVGEIVKQMNAFYQPDDGRCIATPRQMYALVQHLKEYTVLVQAKRQGNALSWAWISPWLTYKELTTESQWALDMAAWQQRLQHYEQAIEEVPRSEWDTEDGCYAIYSLVTAPLLDGIYYEELPGIVLSEEEKVAMHAHAGHPMEDIPGEHPAGHSNPKPPDVVSPFMLGNGILIFREAQMDNLRKFWEDVKENANRIIEKIKEVVNVTIPEIGFPVGIALLGIAALAGVGYVIYRVEKL